MSESPSVLVQKGGEDEYYRRHGIRRCYPPSALPEINKRPLTAEEEEILSKPLIVSARRKKI